MNDPTQLALSGAFAVTLGLFLLGAVRKGFARRDTGVVELPPELPCGKVPVWFYRHVDLVGIGFVFFIFTAMVAGSWGHEAPDEKTLNPAILLVNIGFQFLMAGIVAVVVLRRVNLVSWLGLRWPGWPWVLLIGPGSVLCMWLVFALLQGSGYMQWMESLGVETVQDTVKLLQKSADPVVLGLMAFAAVIAAPVCEEIVFRGYLYPVMKRYAGVWPAALCSALFFGAAHGSLAALLPLFLFGGLLVLIYEKTGSIWAPMAVHCCFNGATVAIQMIARYYQIPLDPMP